MKKSSSIKLFIGFFLVQSIFVACNRVPSLDEGFDAAYYDDYVEPIDIEVPIGPTESPLDESFEPISPVVPVVPDFPTVGVAPEPDWGAGRIPLPGPPPVPIIPPPVVVVPPDEHEHHPPVFKCEGGTSDCNDHNPCTIDRCNKHDECEHDFDTSRETLGKCEVDGSSCTLGQCVKSHESKRIFCQEISRNSIPKANNGCQDDNQCTADSCLELPLKKKKDHDQKDDKDDVHVRHEYDKDGNVILDNKYQCVQDIINGLPCFVEDKCTPGMCMQSGEGTPASEFAIVCVANQDSDPEPFCPNTPQTANNPCKVATCTVGVGCEIVNVADDEVCDDKNPCTENDKCSEGECVGTIKDCDDDVSCTRDFCDGTGECQNIPDSGLCDIPDNQCQVNICDEQGGCTLLDVPEGYPCDDGDPCTVEDICDGFGECESGGPKTCADEDPTDCLVPICTENVGCELINAQENSACDVDGSVCTMDMCDANGICVAGNQMVCADDGNPCTKETCDPRLGCIYPAGNEGQACDDSDPCTSGETCLEGTCQGGEVNDCNDFIDCTQDFCDGQGGCQNIPNNDVCGKSDNACEKNVCDTTNGCQTQSVPAGFSCSDNNPCTLEDTCDGEGNCSSGPLLVCDDNNACTTDSCDVTTGQCASVTNPDANGDPCDDGLQCTKDTTCDTEGNCQGGTQVICDDNSPYDCQIPICNENGGCASGKFMNVANDTPCDDGDICTENEMCEGGVCQNGSWIKCEDDSNPCTNDMTCNADAGGCNWPDPDLAGTSCVDDNPCTMNEACDANGDCVPPSDPAQGMVMCEEPEEPCLEAYCDVVQGCTTRPLTGPFGAECPTAYEGICATGFLRCENGYETNMCEPIFRPGDKVEVCGNDIDEDCSGVIDDCACPLTPAQGSTLRYVDTTGTDAGPNDCTVELSPCATIAHAVSQSMSGDTILVAVGTYDEFGINIGVDLTIIGANAALTIVDAQGNGEVFIVAADIEATFCGITITGGIANNAVYKNIDRKDKEALIASNDGGGINADTGTIVNINSSIITLNSAAGNGGGIYSLGDQLSIIESSVIKNDAGLNGGGILFDGGTNSLADITRSRVNENTATISGGGMKLGAEVTSTILQSTIASNELSSSQEINQDLFGGGIFNSGTLNLSDSIVDSNEVINGNFLDAETIAFGSSAFGGGIYNDGMANISTSQVLNNKAEGTSFGETAKTTLVSGAGRGGGIANIGQCVLDQSSVIGNQALAGGITETDLPDARALEGAGGGIANIGESGIANIINSVVSQNSAKGGILLNGGAAIVGSDAFGGGIANDFSLTIENSTIDENEARAGTVSGATGIIRGVGLGGGIANTDNNTILNINGSTISNNSSAASAFIFFGMADGTSGGGGIDATLATTEITIINSTITGNSATTSSTGVAEGGGIRFPSGEEDIVVDSTTITLNRTEVDNAPGEGSGIYGPVTSITNSIVANQFGGEDDCSETLTSTGYNIESATSCGFLSMGDQQNTDPLLGPLQDNGGPTKTHALLSGSTAIDGGANFCNVSVDQRGEPRPVNIPTENPIDLSARCDIGAYEVQLGELP